MKTNFFWLGLATFFVAGMITAHAQDITVKQKKMEGSTVLGEEEAPAIFKFEPDYLISVEKRRDQIKQVRAIIDTMPISENRKTRLLKDLYKNGFTEKLSKVLLADTKFEDIEE